MLLISLQLLLTLFISYACQTFIIFKHISIKLLSGLGMRSWVEYGVYLLARPCYWVANNVDPYHIFLCIGHHHEGSSEHAEF